MWSKLVRVHYFELIERINLNQKYNKLSLIKLLVIMCTSFDFFQFMYVFFLSSNVRQELRHIKSRFLTRILSKYHDCPELYNLKGRFMSKYVYFTSGLKVIFDEFWGWEQNQKYLPSETIITLIITILKSSSFLVGKMAIKHKKAKFKIENEWEW